MSLLECSPCVLMTQENNSTSSHFSNSWKNTSIYTYIHTCTHFFFFFFLRERFLLKFELKKYIYFYCFRDSTMLMILVMILGTVFLTELSLGGL